MWSRHHSGLIFSNTAWLPTNLAKRIWEQTLWNCRANRDSLPEHHRDEWCNLLYKLVPGELRGMSSHPGRDKEQRKSKERVKKVLRFDHFDLFTAMSLVLLRSKHMCLSTATTSTKPKYVLFDVYTFVRKCKSEFGLSLSLSLSRAFAANVCIRLQC